MGTSAIEQALGRLTIKIKIWIGTHDRGVLTGFILSTIPFTPFSILGLLIGIANLALIKIKRLEKSETSLVYFGLFNAALNMVLLAYFVNILIKGYEDGFVLHYAIKIHDWILMILNIKTLPSIEKT